MVAEVEDEGVLEQARTLQLGRDLADDLVDVADAVVVARGGVAEDFRIGEVGRDDDLVQIGLRRGQRLEVQGTFVGSAVALHVKERRALGPLFPMGLARRLAPDALAFDHVVVLLRVVRGVVARLAQVDTPTETTAPTPTAFGATQTPGGLPASGGPDESGGPMLLVALVLLAFAALVVAWRASVRL